MDGMEVLKEIGINLCFLLCTGILFVLTIILYFRGKKKSTSKYKVEVLTVLVAVLINFVVKFVVILFSDGSSTFLAGLYESVGNFAFEGLSLNSNLTGVYSVCIDCAYICASLYAGAVFVAIVTFKSNYEIASRIASIWKRSRFAKNCDVYIITALTDDTIVLAKSIKDKYNKAKNGSENEHYGKTCLVCFGGNGVIAFDRKNELCRQAMAEGYYYWSFSTGINKVNKSSKFWFAENIRKKSLVEMLKIKTSYNIEHRGCYVLAFSKNIDNIPKVEDNFDLVKNDMEIRILKMDNSHINYFIMNMNYIDYSVYNRMWNELLLLQFDLLQVVDEFKDVKKEKFAKFITGDASTLTTEEISIYEEYKNEVIKHITLLADINIWNETVENASYVIDKILRNTNIYDDVIKRTKETNSNKSDNILVWSFGFGELNQEILKQLFSQLAYIELVSTEDSDKEIKTIGYKVWAFDKEMNNIAGIFGKTYPLCPYVEVEKVDKPEDAMSDALELKRKEYNIYAGFEKDRLVSKEIELPKYYLNAVSCWDSTFFDNLDKVTGISTPLEKREKRPDVILISIGDDYSNIKLANTIIRDICLENEVCEGIKENKQIIVVNVKDKKNNSMILSANGVWDGNILILDNIIVIITGNASEKGLYSFDNVINIQEAKSFYSAEMSLMLKVDCLPNGNSADTKKEVEIINSLLEVYMQYSYITEVESTLGGIKYGDYLEDIKEKLDDALNNSADVTCKRIWRHCLDICSIISNKYYDDVNKNKISIEQSWYGLSAWEKESNKRKSKFYLNNTRRLYNDKDFSITKISELCRIEHYRWLREQISEGWVPDRRPVSAYIGGIKIYFGEERINDMLRMDSRMHKFSDLSNITCSEVINTIQYAVEKQKEKEYISIDKIFDDLLIPGKTFTVEDLKVYGLDYRRITSLLQILRSDKLINEQGANYCVTDDKKMIESARDELNNNKTNN